jgi:hypothetical protein
MKTITKEELIKYFERQSANIVELKKEIARLQEVVKLYKLKEGDNKYTLDDMKKACAVGIDIVNKEGANDFQPFEDLIKSLNK